MLRKSLNICVKAKLRTNSVDNFVDKKINSMNFHYKCSVFVSLAVF